MTIGGAQMALAVAMMLTLATRSHGAHFLGFCSETAWALYSACNAEVSDDRAVKKAICMNIGDADERRECNEERDDELEEGKEFCLAARAGRLAACKGLGEARYDPDFTPPRFDDPRRASKPNPYYPLKVGNKWEYRGGDEFNTVEALNESKLMPGGVQCIVVEDLVWKDGDLVEATDDWFAHAKDGTTWYCGEEVKDFESFDGDKPRKPELVSIDGSFKAGRNGDKAGIIFLASPSQGAVYLEEFSLGNAEDVTEVLSTKYQHGESWELDRFVPKELAKKLCKGDCVVTKNFSLLEPGIFARKYYARGIGFFLEVSPDTGEVLQLVDCNFDARCDGLPTP